MGNGGFDDDFDVADYYRNNEDDNESDRTSIQDREAFAAEFLKKRLPTVTRSCSTYLRINRLFKSLEKLK